jgi:hypothetical protein
MRVPSCELPIVVILSAQSRSSCCSLGHRRSGRLGCLLAAASAAAMRASCASASVAIAAAAALRWVDEVDISQQ